MADAQIIEIADGVVNILNDATLSQSYTAERKYTPEYEIANSTNPHVDVVPRRNNSDMHDRGQYQYDYTIDIGVIDRVGEATQDELDALMLFVEEIEETLRFETSANAACINTENNPIYAREELENRGLFVSVLKTTWRIFA